MAEKETKAEKVFGWTGAIIGLVIAMKVLPHGSGIGGVLIYWFGGGFAGALGAAAGHRVYRIVYPS